MGRVSIVCDVLGSDFVGLVGFEVETSCSPGFEGCIVGTMLPPAWVLVVLAVWVEVAVMRW